VCRTAAADVQVSNAELGFSFTLPDGFESRPLEAEILDGQPNTVAAYMQTGTKGELGTFVFVQRIPGLFSQEAIPATVTTKDGRVLQMTKQPWKSFQIGVARVPETVKGIECVNLNAQIPLSPKAIQITFFSTADHEAELRTLIATVLPTLDGNTNWLTDKEREGKLAEEIGKITGYVIVGALVVYFVRKQLNAR
jgi:hypothetical protein